MNQSKYVFTVTVPQGSFQRDLIKYSECIIKFILGFFLTHNNCQLFKKNVSVLSRKVGNYFFLNL